MRERMIDGPQGELWMSESASGEGRPILFVHSDGGTHRHWDDVRAHLDGRYPTVAFDRRGHGQSAPPRNGSFAAPDAAGDIAAVADAVGYAQFVLVGHSGGALTAFAFAASRPERLAGLVLVDPPPDPAVLPAGVIEETLETLRGDGYENMVDRYYRSIAGEDDAVAAQVVADARSTPQATIIGTFEAMGGFKPHDYAGRYQGPVLSIIQPQYDVDGALHRVQPGFDHIAIDGTGHWIHLAAPDRFAEVLDDFLTRSAGRRNGSH